MWLEQLSAWVVKKISLNTPVQVLLNPKERVYGSPNI